VRENFESRHVEESARSDSLKFRGLSL
jgi:hypothetical protein